MAEFCASARVKTSSPLEPLVLPTQHTDLAQDHMRGSFPSALTPWTESNQEAQIEAHVRPYQSQPSGALSQDSMPAHPGQALPGPELFLDMKVLQSTYEGMTARQRLIASLYGELMRKHPDSRETKDVEKTREALRIAVAEFKQYQLMFSIARSRRAARMSRDL